MDCSTCRHRSYQSPEGLYWCTIHQVFTSEGCKKYEQEDRVIKMSDRGRGRSR